MDDRVERTVNQINRVIDLLLARSMIKYFLIMSVCAAGLFLLGVVFIGELHTITTEVFSYFAWGEDTDSWVVKSEKGILHFSLMCLFFGLIWSCLWLGFKIGEKNFIEVWNSKNQEERKQMYQWIFFGLIVLILMIFT